MVIRAYIKSAVSQSRPASQSRLHRDSIPHSERSIGYNRIDDEMVDEMDNGSDNGSDDGPGSMEKIGHGTSDEEATFKEEAEEDDDSKRPSSVESVELSKTNFFPSFYCKTPNEDGDSVLNKNLRQVFILIF